MIILQWLPSNTLSGDKAKHWWPACMKRLLVNFKSSLLLVIIYKCTKHYNYLQTHLHLIQTNLQASKLFKTHMYRHTVIKNAKLIKAWIKSKLFIDVGLMKWHSLYTDIFQVSVALSLKHCMPGSWVYFQTSQKSQFS